MKRIKEACNVTHKILLLAIAFQLVFLSLRAQSLIIVEKCHADMTMTDAVKFPKKDANHELCGLIRIGLVLPDAEFEGDIISAEYKRGEWWVYMSRGASWITIKTSQYLPLRIDLSAIDGGITYLMTVECPPAEKRSSETVGVLNLDRERKYDQTIEYSYYKTKTKDGLFGIESKLKKTIIFPEYNEIHYHLHKRGKKKMPYFKCIKYDPSGSSFKYALYDTNGKAIIPITKGYNGIRVENKYISCWYNIEFESSQNAHLIRSAIYDCNGVLRIDTSMGLGYCYAMDYYEMETRQTDPRADNTKIITHVGEEKTNYLVGIIPGKDDNPFIGENVIFDMNSWEKMFTGFMNYNGNRGEGNVSDWSNGLICENGFYKFSNGDYIAVYDKKKECVIPYSRRYKKVFSVKHGIYTYFVVGYDEDCWGICDKYGTEIVKPSYDFRCASAIGYVNGDGFYYCNNDVMVLYNNDGSIIWSDIKYMNVYLDEQSKGHYK